MKSWSDWKDFTKENVKTVPANIKGVYVIRTKKNIKGVQSDIIYIGQAGTGNQGVGTRLKNLLKDVQSSEKKWKYHSASQKVKKYFKYGLQYSWLQCFQSPDGVEKAFLLAHKCSSGKLPVCNDGF